LGFSKSCSGKSRRLSRRDLCYYRWKVCGDCKVDLRIPLSSYVWDKTSAKWLKHRPAPQIPPGTLGLGNPQRDWGQWSLTDTLNVARYDPFSSGRHVYLGSLDVELAFATKKISEEQYDQEDLSKIFIRVRNCPHSCSISELTSH